MSAFLSKTFYGNTVGEWALAFAIIVAALVAGKIVYTIAQN